MIKLANPQLAEEEIKAIRKVFNSGWVSGNGPTGELLAQKMNERYGFLYSLPVSNCTAALHLSLISLGIKEGDEVLVSDYTFPASGHSVKYVGANPIFVDVDIQTYNFDIDDAKRKLTRKTKAIICVHTFGQMCVMDEIKCFAVEHNLKIIEDAACALGAKYKNWYAGTLGDIGCFSMHARKNITCGEGGLMTFLNEEDYQKSVKLSAFGQTRAYVREKSKESTVPVFCELGFNYKLSDIACAVLLAQLEKYDSILETKRQLAAYYDNLLVKNDGVLSPPYVDENCEHVYQAYVCKVKEPYDRNGLINFLKQNNIQTQIGTYSSCIQPVYGVHPMCEGSIELYDRCIALPLHIGLTEKDINFIVVKINEYVGS